MKKITLSFIAFILTCTATLSYAGFQGQFSKCHWVTKGDLSQGGYYYLCDNDLQGGWSAIWAKKESCRGSAVSADSTYNTYFCNDGHWEYHEDQHPPCVCTGDFH